MARTDDDTWDLASSVGATATMVAAARAMASKADTPLIDDPYAEPLVRAVGLDLFTRLATGELSPADLEDDSDGSPAGVQRMTDNMAVRTKFFDEFFIDATNAGIKQAVILASIVEKETALATERPHVAAVFINRLAKGMRLESDPTVVYGLTGGTPLGHGLRVSELARKTPYNTYLVAGLPPTPIANPGRAALEAALDPAPSEDLYFVADGTGGHVFSTTLAQHLKNVARWRAVEHQVRGGGR